MCKGHVSPIGDEGAQGQCGQQSGQGRLAAACAGSACVLEEPRLGGLHGRHAWVISVHTPSALLCAVAHGYGCRAGVRVDMSSSAPG